MDTQTQKLIDDATAGLRHDPELRMDVQKELLTHLEQAAKDFRAEGREDAEEQARKTFGSPLELAAELLDGNRRRLRLRALARLFAQALLVPLAVLAALYLGYGGIARLSVLLRNPFFGFFESLNLSIPSPPGSFFPTQRQMNAKFNSLDKSQAFSSGYHVHLRRLWEQHRQEPDAREYYGYYAGFIQPELRHPRFRLRSFTLPGVPVITPRTTSTPSNSEEARAFTKFEEEMRLGERVDPDNALYHLKLANAYLRDGLLAKSEKTQELQPGESSDNLYDPLLVDLGVAEVHAMLQKPVLTTYSMAMIRRRDASLPPAKLSEGYQLHSATGILEFLPILSEERALARRIPGCIRLLIKQGRMDEANYLLENWWLYPKQLTRGSHTLIDLLSVNAIIKSLGTEVADINQSLGHSAEADRVRQDVTRLTAAIEAQKKFIKNRAVSERDLRQHGAFLANRYVGNIMIGFYPSIAEMRPARLYEYTMLEEFATSLAMLLLAVLMLTAAVTSFAWLRTLRERGAVPLLLLPDWRESARIVLLGLVLPLAAYVLYSRLPIGGRDYGLYTNWPRFLAEMVLMLGILLYLPKRLMRTTVRRRCRELDISLPKPGFSLPKLAPPLVKLALQGFMLIITVIMAATMLTMMFDDTVFDEMYGRTAGFAIDTLVVLINLGSAVLFFILIIRSVNRIRQMVKARVPTDNFALYRGTLARSLIPLYAAAVILLGGLAQPLLLQQEARWLRQDHSLYPTLQYAEYPLAPGTVEQMKAQVLQAAEEIAREGK